MCDISPVCSQPYAQSLVPSAQDIEKPNEKIPTCKCITFLGVAVWDF